MKRILINATHNEEIRVALCKGNQLYDFDLENRTREQKKANIYKGHVTRVEPSLEAVFVEYGSERQGFLPIREIANEYLSGNPRDENIKKLIKEGDELIVQVEKEERGNKGAALSTYVSLAGRYLVLMPNNPRGGGISRQISGKLRDDMKRMLSNLSLPKGMSVIIRTAGIGKTQEDLQHDLNHLLSIWEAIQSQNKSFPSPRLVHQEAGVVTRAVRDYLRDDIAEIWVDNENAYNEAANFIQAVMPKQSEKLRKYTDYEPMFARFGIEKQIETAYQREVRLPSGGSIVIDQTEALVSIDINSAKSTKGSDVAETAYHTNLEAAEEIARQLRLRDMGGLIVIDFIDMNENKHQKDVEKRLVESTKYDRARVQFGEISKFGLMEMSRQRLRPSLEESTGYICPRCHGNGMIRDLRSLSLSIMRQIEQIALKERQGEVQAEVPTDIAAFLLNEKRDSLVYLEQDSGTRITILPHAHLESPNFKLHFNRDGFAPSSYERITDTQQQEFNDRGYEIDWQTAENERPEHQPTRQPRSANSDSKAHSASSQKPVSSHSDKNQTGSTAAPAPAAQQAQPAAQAPQAVAWLSNLFAPTPQASTAAGFNSQEVAHAIESLVNTGAQSLGAQGSVDPSALVAATRSSDDNNQDSKGGNSGSGYNTTNSDDDDDDKNKKKRKSRKSRSNRSRSKKDKRSDYNDSSNSSDKQDKSSDSKDDKSGSHSQSQSANEPSKRRPNSQRDSRGELTRGDTLDPSSASARQSHSEQSPAKSQDKSSNKEHDKSQAQQDKAQQDKSHKDKDSKHSKSDKRDRQNPNDVSLQVTEAPERQKSKQVVHLSLDDSKPEAAQSKADKADSSTDTSSKAQAQDSATSKDAKTAVSDETASRDATSVTNDKALDERDNNSNSRDNSRPAAETSEKATQAPAKATAAADASDATDESDTPAGVGYSAASIFADRYITAMQYGQASNDPRLVRAQHSSAQTSEQQASKPSTSAPAAARTPIAGSVGEFIRAVLADAEARLASEGVVACFIKAVDAARQGSPALSEAVTTDADSNRQSTATASFDFSNYGYAPLDDGYLAQFSRMTHAVSMHSVTQGKTAVSERPVGKRASNDPRGQHPAYQPSTDDSAPSSESHANADVKSAEAAESAAGSASDVHHAAADVAQSSDAQIPDVQASDAHALASVEQTEAVSKESEQLLDADQALHDAQSDSISAELDESETDSKAANKTKTTAASYKNMIENVAEQLLPQTGMFNLTAPKAPKSRSRKPKTEHKKPTQVEQQNEQPAEAPADSTSADSQAGNEDQ